MQNSVRLKPDAGLSPHSRSLSVNDMCQWLLIFWIGGWGVFLPQSILSLLELGLAALGAAYFVLKLCNRGLSRLDLAVLALTFLYPLVAGMRAQAVFGQPVLTGILSLRGIWILFLAYFLRSHFSTDSVVHKILKYNLAIMCVGTVALYLLGIDDNVINLLKPVREDIVLTGTTDMENELRGARLTFGSSYLLFAFAYWSVWYFQTRDKTKLWNLLGILLYIAFVHKGRAALVSCVVIFLLPQLSHLTIAKIRNVLGIMCIVGLAVVAIPALRERFLVIFDLFGVQATAGTNDFSGVARLTAILLALPFILDHPFFGVGNLSYHFHNGFIGYFNEHFYLSDIGIVGTLLVGGVFLLVLYAWFYGTLIRCARRYVPDPVVRQQMTVLCVFYMLDLFMGVDIMFNKPSMVALILFFCAPALPGLKRRL